ncbi:MAG: tol-pal system protein YbgF [bacterium]|nr:tol-pal system protein YbgF [bacterium]
MRLCFCCLTLALTLAVTGCSSNLMSSSGASATEIEDLKRRLLDAERRATVGEVDVARLKRRIVQLETDLRQAQAATRPSVAPETSKPETPAASAPETRPPAAQPEIEEIDLEPEPIAQAPPPEPAPAPPTGPATTGAPTPLSEEAQALYDEGYTHFHQQQYGEAEERFQRYVERYPGTELSDNASFWIGECRYARGEYSSALDAFTATVERYPKGNKIGDALFKAGKCLEALGDAEQAKSTYGEVASRFPGTGAAALARERLAELR